MSARIACFVELFLRVLVWKKDIFFTKKVGNLLMKGLPTLGWWAGYGVCILVAEDLFESDGIDFAISF